MRALRLILILAFQLFISQLFGQLTGTVTDAQGPLPFASVYIEGTTIGTTTNNDGIYVLPLKNGKHQIVFQYVGYQSITKEVNYFGQPITLDISLTEADFTLPDIVVRADAEDPAYPIIRKAMAKRKFYKNQIDTFSCHVYVKGVVKIEDAPEKTFGSEIGTMGGVLDTNRQGILYFSESISRLYYKNPKYKEVVESVKVSGEDKGYGFNSATIMTISLYEKTLTIGRDIVSPIAPNAMHFYRYKLVGTVTGKDGKDINKIKLIPKRSADPVFSGFIYIRDDYWDIQGTDVWLTGKNAKQPMIDTMRLKQNYFELKPPNTWMLQSQTMTYNIKIFGFDIFGYFNGVVSDYKLNDTEPIKWNQDVYVVNDGANEKNITFWDSIRPIPLSLEESHDYVKKDSLHKVWTSKSYLDSIDHDNNKFGLDFLLTGYTYDNSYKHTQFFIKSPLSTITFNSVQGTTYGMSVGYKKSREEKINSEFKFKVPLDYSMAEKKFRARAILQYEQEKKSKWSIELSGGQQIQQFDNAKPIHFIINELYSLIGKKNYMKIYDENFGKIKLKAKLNHGLDFTFSSKFSERSPLVNHTNYSWFKKEKLYESNTPLEPANFEPSFTKHRAFVSTIGIRWTPKMQYNVYPNKRVPRGSKFPTFGIYSRIGLPINSSISYQTLTGSIHKNRVHLGVWGYFNVSLKGGLFIKKDSIPFMDYFHFQANETWIALRSFRLMPYYTYSTTNPFAKVALEHHFKGRFLDRIPLIRKLGWNEVLGFSAIYTEDQGDYLEVNVGFENIGIKMYRGLRVDFVSAFAKGRYLNSGITVGLGM